MRDILYLDLDGTIRRPKSSEYGFIQHPEDQELYPGVVDRMRDKTVVGITNQLWVLKGYKSLHDCIEEQRETLRLCNGLMDFILFCPDEGETCHLVSIGGSIRLREKGQNFRKPHAGMIYMARRLLIETGGKETMVGDMEIDKLCAQNAGIAFRWAKNWRNYG